MMLWELKKCWYRTYQTVFKLAMNFLDWSEPQLLEGNGSILQLPEFIKSKGISKVLVVTDKGLMGLHLLDPMFEKLTEVGIEYVVYDEVQPNPTIPNIEATREMYVKNGCQGFIAFGGGSPMDCAKAAAARVVKPRQSVRQMRGYLKVLKKLPPFFAVPTTAGTGSETTVAAVVSDPETHEKNAINDICLRPRYAVLDPALTVGLPPHITSTTGMDALTHAVEAFIGQSTTKQTRRLALEATEVVFGNVERAYKDGHDREAREHMLHAAYKAGIAFSKSYVGYIHAVAHSLGGQYNVPHGYANAILMPIVLDEYGSVVYSKLHKLGVAAKVAGSTPMASASSS